MRTNESTETKYIARRLVALGLVVVVLVTAVLFNTIKAEVYNAMYPPPPEPASALRLEKITNNCWDVLAIRHDEDFQALMLTIMETCQLPPMNFSRVHDAVQDMAAEFYQGEAFVATEWVIERQGKYMVVALSVCEGAPFIMDPATATCSNYPVETIVPSSTVRRWWLND